MNPDALRFTAVPGFPGYFVDEEGNVLGRRGWILVPDCSDRYARVTLYDAEKRRRAVMVHRLVLRAFVGPIPPGHEVNHKNGKTMDNRLVNLEYVTPSDNMRHAYSVLRRTITPPPPGTRRTPVQHHGELNPTSKVTDAEVAEIRAAYEAAPSTYGLFKRIGEQYGITAEHASRLARGLKRGGPYGSSA